MVAFTGLHTVLRAYINSVYFLKSAVGQRDSLELGIHPIKGFHNANPPACFAVECECGLCRHQQKLDEWAYQVLLGNLSLRTKRWCVAMHTQIPMGMATSALALASLNHINSTLWSSKSQLIRLPAPKLS
jgi:hypothetical protein